MAKTTYEEVDASDVEGSPPPGPDGLPILGSIFKFENEHFEFLKELKQYGDVATCSVVNHDFCVVFHPDLIESVLTAENMRRHAFEDFGASFLSEGLFKTHGEQWERQRRLTHPAFHVDTVPKYVDTATRYTIDCVEGWDDGEVVSMTDEMETVVSRKLANILLGLEVDGRTDVVRRAVDEMNHCADGISVMLPEWLPTPASVRLQRALGALRERINELIAHRRNQPEAADDILATLVNSTDEDGVPMSDEEIRHQMLTMLIGAHEPMALALTYTMLLLERSPDVREKLRAEFEEVLDGRNPTLTDLLALEYTGSVIDESMRLYPPIYGLYRRPTEDLDLGGYTVEEGTVLYLPQHPVQRDERFYDDPEEFDPDRWAERDDRHKYAFFPFGRDKHSCMGRQIARQSMKLMLPILYQRVELELLSDPQPDLAAAAALRPTNPITFRVHKR